MPPIGWYQVILLGDRGTCANNLPRVALDSGVQRLGFEPTTYWMQAKHSTATPQSHTLNCVTYTCSRKKTQFRKLPRQQLYLWYNSVLSRFKTTHHRVAFASTGLSVSKDTNIISLQGMFQHLNTKVFVNLFLTSKSGITCLQTANTSYCRRPL